MITIADIFIYTVFDTYHALSCGAQRVQPGPHATLALELDYRFQSLDKVPSDETFLGHIRAANATVRRYIETEVGTMRLMVFRCEPKPKLSESKKIGRAHV